MSKLPLVQEEKEKPWYHKGLHFKCTGCGKCCSGSPGYVFLTEEDIARFTKHLKITTEVFIKRYTKSFHGRISLRDDTPNYGCIFLKEGKYCGAYEARPSQCRNYPFWPMNLSSQEEWNEEGKRCEGINHPDAPLIPLEEIEAIRDLDS